MKLCNTAQGHFTDRDRPGRFFYRRDAIPACLHNPGFSSR